MGCNTSALSDLTVSYYPRRWTESLSASRGRESAVTTASPGHSPPRTQAVTGHQPMRSQNPAFHPSPRRRADTTSANGVYRAAGKAPHLDLAVIETGCPRLVLRILRALAHRPVQASDLPRVQLSELVMRVRFPSPAPTRNRRSAVAQVLLRLPLGDYEPPAGYGVIFRQGSVQGFL
jgi:hypothetical protein